MYCKFLELGFSVKLGLVLECVCSLLLQFFLFFNRCKRLVYNPYNSNPKTCIFRQKKEKKKKKKEKAIPLLLLSLEANASSIYVENGTQNIYNVLEA